jgi:isocitrate/isopropylmalate dehydrogenase
LADKKSDRRLKEASLVLESAVVKALSMGYKTPDIGGDKRTDEIGKSLYNIIKNF